MLERIRNARAYVSGEGLGAFLVRAVAGSGAVRIGAMAAGFAVGVQLARMLGVEGYGYYGLALSIVTIAGIPGEMGIPQLLTREVAVARARNDLPKLFGVLRWAEITGMRVAAVMAVIVIVTSAILARSQPLNLSLTLLLGAPIIPFMVLVRLRGGALQGLHHVVRGQIPQNLLRPLFLSILLLLFYLFRIEVEPWAGMASNTVAAGLSLVIANHWLRQRLPDRSEAEVVREGRRWLTSSIPMALTDGMRALQAELSVLILGLLTMPTEVGLFRVAIATSFAAAAPITAINQVAFSVIARLHVEQDWARLQKVVTNFARAQFIGVVALCLPIMLAAGPLLSLVFGPGFAPAALALKIMAGAQVVNAAFGPNIVLLNMTNHERRVTRAMTFAMIVNIVLVVVLGALWKGVGAAIGVAVALLWWNLMTWLDARRLLGIETSIFPATKRLSARRM